jgi:hypothetical protein
MLSELQSGIWSELKQANPVIDIYRRNLQRSYLARVQSYFDPDLSSPSEIRAALRGSLSGLQSSIKAVLPKVKDTETILHLRDSVSAIEQTLNPRR